MNVRLKAAAKNACLPEYCTEGSKCHETVNKISIAEKPPTTTSIKILTSLATVRHVAGKEALQARR